MIEMLTDPNLWAAFLTLAALEIVLGIDNIIFISIVTGKLPLHQQPRARQIGLSLALGMRVVMLLGISWIAGLTEPVMTVADFALSWRDIVLGLGGLFLLYKATGEIHETMEGDRDASMGVGTATFSAIIFQVVLLDLVFSLDSVITAVGMTDNIPVMIAAVVVSILVMMFAATPVSAFVNRHPTVKMLALGFLLLIGVALIADALHYHIPRGYLYFAIGFSALMETLNLLASRAKKMARANEQ
ncbi:MAG: TerC family protein [Alphaproteobacteria bacterium]|nr:TerC family protein [Alphaproteobacteria bacterium]